jgi:hypothetical protein
VRSTVLVADSSDDVVVWRCVPVEAQGVLDAELGQFLLGVGLESHVAGMADEFERHRSGS